MNNGIVYRFIKKRFLLLILLAGGMVRIGMLIANLQDNSPLFNNKIEAIHQKITSSDSPFIHAFGAEISNVAYSIVCKKEGFSSPFGGHTGATGWVAPGMVAIYAFSFYMFGCFTFSSIMFVFLLSLVFSLIMIVIVYHLCVELFNDKIIASIGAVLFAFDPQDVFIFKRINQQDFNIIVFLFLLVFYLFVRCIRSGSIKNTFCVALAAGTAMLFNPVFVIPVILLLLFVVMRGFFTIKQGALFMIVVFSLVSPYILYQKQRLKTWTFIKSNGPFEIYQGNVPDFFGVLTLELFNKYHPIMNQEEYNQYKTMGERDYIASRLMQFKNNFDLGLFLKLSFKKVMYFFFVYPPLKVREQGTPAYLYIAYSIRGLALLIFFIIRVKGITVYDSLLYLYIIGYALPYFFTGMMYRYSFPIVPLTTMLGAYSICTLWHQVTTGRGRTHLGLS